MALVLPFVTPGGHALAFLHLGAHTFVLTSIGLDRGLALLLRLTAAVLPVTALTARLGTASLLEALDGLRVPPVFLSLIGFTLRYTDVLSGESRRMLTARRSRGFRVTWRLVDRRAIATFGELLGVLLLRARERSERVYLAMLSRGYRATSAVPGRRRPPLFGSAADAALVFTALAAAVTFKLLDGSL
jgi:cobalt/nickel transport system permease protein